ncbi:MAG TPA: hypothetical protein VMS79_00725 [Methanomassiliicoccales archaeon]|nr:hypothetical protein [Methanomassiliicoccales archaeon]
MNERDTAQTAAILRSIRENGLAGAVLIDAPFTQFVRVNLMMLKGLSQDSRLPGVFVSVDRPHQYIVHLLSMHQIRAENLVFIDAISRFSADSKVAEANVGFLDGPFHIDRLTSAFSEMKWANDGTALKDVRFALIDNLSALLTYNSFSAVESFLATFVRGFEPQGNVLIPLIIDSERSRPLYEVAKSLCAKEIGLRDLGASAPQAAVRSSGAWTAARPTRGV